LAPLRVGLLGLGTVGGATAEVLRRNREEIRRRAGREIVLACACVRDPGRKRPVATDGIELVADSRAVVAAREIDVVVELMGGLSPARQWVLEALEHGKHVVTANKALIALHGDEIFAAARRRGVVVAFEAAVAGGIPIVKAIREGLAGNRIASLAGIINGTTNYILSAMGESRGGFADILAEAQRLGYAEADPRFDIEGTDAAHKLTILAAIAFGIPLRFDRVYREGIEGIAAEDIAYARELGYCVKHLGIARRSPEGIELRVHPTLVPRSHLLAGVCGAMNAVFLHGDALGANAYYGPGAGGAPTASAVVADLVDISRMMGGAPERQVPYLAFEPLEDIPVLDMERATTAYYLRLQAEDRPGVLSQVAGILGEFQISIEAVLQKEPASSAARVPVILLTQQVLEGRMDRALAKIRRLDAVSGDIARIRLETLA